MLTREQEYAAAIMKQVKGVKQDHPDLVESYGAMAHKLPVLIRTAGLAQALAFLAARPKKGAYQLLLQHITEVTLGRGQSTDELLARSRGEKQEHTGLNDYMRLSQQVLAALLWYKRFAQSVLDVDPTADPESSTTSAPSTPAPAVPTAGDTP